MGQHEYLRHLAIKEAWHQIEKHKIFLIKIEQKDKISTII